MTDYLKIHTQYDLGTFTFTNQVQIYIGEYNLQHFTKDAAERLNRKDPTTTLFFISPDSS